MNVLRGNINRVDVLQCIITAADTDVEECFVYCLYVFYRWHHPGLAICGHKRFVASVKMVIDFIRSDLFACAFVAVCYDTHVGLGQISGRPEGRLKTTGLAPKRDSTHLHSEMGNPRLQLQSHLHS